MNQVRQRTSALLLLFNFALSLALAFACTAVIRSFMASTLATLRTETLLLTMHSVEEGDAGHPFGRIERMGRDTSYIRNADLWITDGSGKILDSSVHATGQSADRLPVPWTDLPKPAAGESLRVLAAPGDRLTDLAVARFQSADRYLVIRANRIGPIYHLFAERHVLLLALISFIQIGSFILTRAYLGRKSLEAKRVFTELMRGNLKARFKTGWLSGSGGLLFDFNRMADEIERLVNQVKSTEQSRRNMLRELGHDLRTPLTSLQVASDSLDRQAGKSLREDTRELVSLIGVETGYMSQLVENLLLIIEIAEPTYERSSGGIDINALVEAEAGRAALLFPCIRLETRLPSRSVRISGDLVLLQRLVRNALDNACRYARSRVEIGTQVANGRVELSFADDGPGLTEKALAEFGRRRETRVRSLTPSSAHYSLGLGSVIISTVARLHGGETRLINRLDGSGNVLGAELRVGLGIEVQ